MRDLAIIGAGTVGKALGRRLADAGWPVRALACRTIESARAAVAFVGQGEAFDDAPKAAQAGDVVLLAVPDDRIQEVAESLARWGSLRKGAVLIHVSGGRSSSAMAMARDSGAHVASMHPLQTFASADEQAGPPGGAADLLSGVLFACEGDEEALPVVREIVDVLGGRFVAIDGEKKALYHAGAVIACNYLVTLVAAAAELFEEAGIPRDEAVRALAPLLRGTVANLERVGLPRALTGPIARGDADTVEIHAREIARTRPDLLPLYQALGIWTIPLATQKGAMPEGSAERVERALSKERGHSHGGARRRRGGE